MDIDTINLIRTDKEISFHGLRILPFSKSHDAGDPVSYLIENRGTKISVMTDIGFCCDNVKHSLKESELIILESNHDVDMLRNGPYPLYLKQRIAGNKGHLSNYDAAVAVLEYGNKNLRHALLSHLSLNNNTPGHALHTFTSIVQKRSDLRNLQAWLSYREEPTALIRLDQ
jgi:phosphoribosyl 1,2-cyclic phosphodiesterase